MRVEADLDAIVDRLIALYRESIAEQAAASSHDVRDELRELSRLIAYCDRSKELWSTDYIAGETTRVQGDDGSFAPNQPVDTVRRAA